MSAYILYKAPKIRVLFLWMNKVNSYVYFFKECKHFLNCLVFEDKKNEAICTTKYLEAEKVKINEKPQNDAECLR